MKNKLSRIISSVLIVAFLVSCLAVFVYADDSTAGTDDTTDNAITEKDITLLVNRTYDEGWNALNGFTANLKGHKTSIEYEETKNFDYNYYTRIESVTSEEGYIEMKYGGNSATYGNTMLEVDLKIDDATDIGKIAYMRASNLVYSLMAIKGNSLYLLAPGDHAVDDADTVQSYLVGSLGEDWVHVAMAYTVGRRKCPNCGTVHTLTSTTSESDTICCKDEGGVKVSNMEKLISARIYFGYSETFDVDAAVNANGNTKEKDLTSTYYIDVNFLASSYVEWFRFGLPTSSTNKGESYLMDNFKVYNGAEKPVEISKGNYGLNVLTNQAKTEEILSADAEKTALQYIAEGIVMKVGVDYCLDTNEKRSIFEKDGVAYGAPVKIDGEVYVPLQAILDWIGYPMYQHDDKLSYDISTEKGSTFVTIGRNTATVNGTLVELSAAPGYATDKETGEQYLVVAVDDVKKLFEGYNVTYDDMGLIAISLSDKDVFNRDTDLDMMLDLMRSFIYDYNTGDGYYEAAKVKTNGFDHPYILANQDDFDRLNTAYTAEEDSEGYDADLKAYLTAIEKQAAAVYAEFAVADPEAAGKYLAADIINPNIGDENNGYDKMAGRLEAAAEYNEKLRVLALGYQITRNEDYAKLAYEFAVSMSKWDHWGPAYFVNCADATTAYAMAYDWLYDAWTDLGYDLSVIEAAIYLHGILEGYRSSTGQECEHINDNQDMSAYINSTDSWNIISTSGMVIGSLALLGVDYVTTEEGRYDMAYDDYVIAAKYLLENNIVTLIDNALELYAPDGSFEESATYWSYATNSLALMSWALEYAVGTDMGLMNTWGIDKTFYQALQLEFSSYGDYITEDFDFGASTGLQIWNYHESEAGSQNTELFYYAAYTLEDDALAALRKAQLDKKTVSIWDVLGYRSEYSELTTEGIDLELGYAYVSLDGITARSDWEDGAIYVGIMGNRNDVANGQIDSGNFVYAAKNFTWFTDLGAEDHNVNGSGDSLYRYGYYRNNAEGANTVIVYSDTGAVPYGQTLDSRGVLEDYAIKDEGVYAIINNTEVYGETVTKAYRGMLFTNNRKTVVIQDEIAFYKVRSCAWVAQTASEIIIADDGRSAYLKQEIDGEICWVRATIVSNNDLLTFSTVDTYNFFVNSHAKNYSTKLGKAPERDRSMYKRLVIRAENVLTFNCSVVIETVYDEYSSEAVEYEFKEMNSWTPDMITDTFVPTVVDETKIGNTDLYFITTYGAVANRLAESGIAFSNRTTDFFYNLAMTAATVKEFQSSSLLTEVKEVYDVYRVYKDETLIKYNMYRENINSIVEKDSMISIYLGGYSW